MSIVYLFSGCAGVLLSLLSLLGSFVAQPDRASTSSEPDPVDPDATDSPAGGSPAHPLPASARLWTLPLSFFGIVGFTLDLLGRDFLPTLLWSVAGGIPSGLLAAWVLHRLAGRASD